MPVRFKSKSAIFVGAACILLSACDAKRSTLGTTNAGSKGLLSLGGATNPSIKALDGSVIGGSIGKDLDGVSKKAALSAEYNALEKGNAGKPISWQGANGARGVVTPQQAYQVGSQNCRGYSHTIFVNDVEQNARGTACRDKQGTWAPLS